MSVIKAEFFSVMNVIYGLGTRKIIPETDPNSSKRFQRGPDPQHYYEVSTYNSYSPTASVADPDLGSGAFLTPGSGIRIRDGKIQIQDLGSKYRILFLRTY
jgi:hypothetical protein